MVIFKGKTQRVIKDISNSHGAVVSFQKEAWMDEMQMIKWIDDVWIKYTKKRCSLLILDSCTAHLTMRVQDSFRLSNTSVLVIPGGCTSVLQPLDVSINKPVKSVLRKCWETYMIEQVDTNGIYHIALASRQSNILSTGFVKLTKRWTAIPRLSRNHSS